MVAAVCVFARKQVQFIFYLLDLEEPWDTDQGVLFERDHREGFPRTYLFSWVMNMSKVRHGIKSRTEPTIYRSFRQFKEI